MLDERALRRVEPSAITKVSALGVEEQRVNVLIDIDSPRAQWPTLGDGFRVGVRLVVIQTHKALQLPVSAVFPRPVPRSYALRLRRRAVLSTARRPRASIAHVEGSGTGAVRTWFASLSGTPASLVKARKYGLLNPLLAKTDAAPPGANFSIVLPPWFAA